MLSSGTLAPGFALPDDRGRVLDLADLRGSWTVLWFYVKAATSG